MAEEKQESKKEFRGIVRVANKDLKGEFLIRKALSRVRGIGSNLSGSIAHAAERELGIPENEKIGNLTDEQIKALEAIIADPAKHGIPKWMLNRRRGAGGKDDVHVVSSDLEFQQRQDIQFQKNIKSYRGIRHMFGLAVRGQRTKTWGRKGMTLGVIKKKEMPAAAKKGGGEKEKKK